MVFSHLNCLRKLVGITDIVSKVLKVKSGIPLTYPPGKESPLDNIMIDFSSISTEKRFLL